MKASKKRGFTIIELVIVIAVVAILAAVLIPTFSNVIQKAKEANDTIMVKTMNTALVNDSNLNGGKKHTTMSDALTAAKSAGYDVTKIRNTANNNEILWDSVSDCFVYMKSGEITYIPDSKDSAADTSKLYNYYRIVDNAAAVAASDYSTYMANNEVKGDITAKAGFDAGENVVIASVTYATSDKQSVVIRTNSGKLTVDAANAHVEHYNIAESVEVKNVGPSTYVEHGVVAKMTVEADKKVVIKSSAMVVALTTASDKITVESDAYIGAVDGDKKDTVQASGDTIKVGTYEELQALALTAQVGISLSGKTIELTADIDLTGKVWTPFGFSEQNLFEGTIDGKGHKIVGLNGDGATKCATVKNNTNGASGHAYGFICIAGEGVVVKNVNFVDVNIDIPDGLAVGAVVGDARGDITISNVNVSGKISGKDKVGGLVGLFAYSGNQSAKGLIENCTNSASVTAISNEKYNRAGGIIGAGGPKGESTLTIKNCANKGNISVKGNSGPVGNAYFDQAKRVSDIGNAQVVQGGHFVGQLNATTLVSEGNTHSGTIIVTNEQGKGGTYAFVNKFGEANGTVSGTTQITANEGWKDFIYETK